MVKGRILHEESCVVSSEARNVFVACPVALAFIDDHRLDPLFHEQLQNGGI